MVDEAMEAYVEWREECIRVWDADQGWRSAVSADAALAFPAYVAALDREERASEVYAGVIGRLERLLATFPQSDGERPAPEAAAS
jgi:anti-sigma-K factor RskA